MLKYRFTNYCCYLIEDNNTIDQHELLSCVCKHFKNTRVLIQINTFERFLQTIGTGCPLRINLINNYTNIRCTFDDEKHTVGS